MSSHRRNILGTLASQFVSLSLTGAIVLSTLPTAANAAFQQPEGDEAAQEAEPSGAEDSAAPAMTRPNGSGTVAVLRFTNDQADESGYTLRDLINTGLVDRGYTLSGIKRDAVEAAKKNKCQLSSDDCLQKLGLYLNKNAKTPFDFYVFGLVGSPGAAAEAGQTRIVVYNIAESKKVVDFVTTPLPGDPFLNFALTTTVAEHTVRSQNPLPELSEEARQALINPPEPEKTAEEVQEEKAKLAEAERQANAEARDVALNGPGIDLKRDFKSVCRTGPRQDRESVDENGKQVKQRDLSPSCKLGPRLGYWQPRSWVVGGAMVGSALVMAGFYTLSLTKRSAWKDAKKELEDSGVSATKPSGVNSGVSCDRQNNDKCYANLAGKVVDAADEVRSKALAGDVALGVTILMGGVLALMTWQDRTAAKKYLEQERALKISDLQFGPMVGGGNYGAAMRFKF